MHIIFFAFAKLFLKVNHVAQKWYYGYFAYLIFIFRSDYWLILLKLSDVIFVEKKTNFSSQQQWQVNTNSKQQPWDIAFLFTNKQVAVCEEMFTEYYIYV